MRWLALLGLIALPALAQEPGDVSDGLGMMTTPAGDYAEVRPETEIRFPEDHGPHPAFRIEWWYVTANLRDAEGDPIGAQWTLFRFATAPGGAPEDAGWSTPQIWMGHAAVTTAERHRAAESFARGGIGQAGVETGPFRAWIDDWVFEHAGEGGQGAFAPLRMTARGDGFAYDLRLEAEGPMVLQGEDGYSVKSDRGQASHYASQPFFRVAGTFTLDGATREVTGRAWMDREWSSQPLAEGQTGWDWLSLHLDEGPDAGDKLMVYRLRDEVGGDYVTGNWIAANGASDRLAPGEIAMTPIGGEVEVHPGVRMPVRWRVEIPGRGLAIETRPLNPRAWNPLSTAYWEGPVFFEGTHAGEGYLEMTGE